MDKQSKSRVAARLDRIAYGNFGDCKAIGEGLYELRLDFGPGYRIYYATVGKTIILLLCAGDKHHQEADIRNAKEYWADYLKRSIKP